MRNTAMFGLLPCGFEKCAFSVKMPFTCRLTSRMGNSMGGFSFASYREENGGFSTLFRYVLEGGLRDMKKRHGQFAYGV